MQETVTAYFAQFEKRDAEMRAMLEAGEIDEAYYKQWRINQIGCGKSFEALRDEMTRRMADAGVVAYSYINNTTPGIYSLNRNFAAYTVELMSGKTGFALWDERTVRRLLVENPDLMPYYPKKLALKRGFDIAWGKKCIKSAVTSSILQGHGIRQMADTLQRKIPAMNRDSAIRAARTAVTGAQNGGRQDTYHAAAGMGIKLKKEWLATLDGRTRPAHGIADGQQVNEDKPFVVDGYKMMYPGDTSAPGYLVYNCFVGETQIASDSKIVRSYKHTYKGDLIEVKTACGINFTCTPNHPILTPYGWVAAALLHNGDNLVVTFGRNTGSFRWNSDIKHIHSSMKALYNSLHCFGLMSRDSTLRINFHGDIPTTNVEVITKKWLLRNDGNSGVRQSINKFPLKNTNKPLMSQCPFMKHFGSVCKAALRFVSSKCQTLALLWRSLFHPDIHGFRTVSWRDVGVTQDTVNNLTAKSETLGKVLDGFSGEIAVDKVVSIKIIPSGQTATHVYNLQTQNGYYFVNSSIPQSGTTKCNGIFAIAKNCRCTTIAVVDGVDTSSAQRRARNADTGQTEVVSNMSYAEWVGWKKETNQVASAAKSAIIKETDKPISYKQFDTGDAANVFFYYDGDERGLLAKKRSKHAQWQKSLTEDEDYAIGDYTGGGYWDINSYLRKTGDWESINAESVKQQIKGLDSAISRYELKDNIRVQRGVTEGALDGLISQYGDDNAELIGKIYKDSGYMSTTALKGNAVANAKPVVFDIEVPSGTGRGAYVNQLAGQYQDTEYEFLVARNSKFEIIAIEENDEPIPPQTIIRMRMIVDE